MLIGIDETGTVVAGETFIIAAALIRPTSIQRAEGSLRRWEETTRRRLPGRPDEIKSSVLDEEARRDFVNKVLWPEGNGIRYFAVAAEIDDRVLAWGAAQRDRFVSGLVEVEKEARGRGVDKYANSVRTLTGWMRKTTPGMTIKMMMLGVAAAKAVNMSIVTSVREGFDEELGDLRCYIDQGFVRGGPERWRYMFRNHLMQATQTDPPILIDTWGPNHPFLATFVSDQRGDYMRLTPEFGQRFDFYDSRDASAVRLADIVAGLIRSKAINKSRAPWGARAWERSVGDGIDWLDFTHTEDFSDEVETGLVNLFEEWHELADPLGEAAAHSTDPSGGDSE